MATWNEIFLERLFNHSSIDTNGNFILPEGYGSENNYSRVISLFRKLYDVKFKVILKREETGSYWRATKEDTPLCTAVGYSPEEAIEELLTRYNS